MIWRVNNPTRYNNLNGFDAMLDYVDALARVMLIQTAVHNPNNPTASSKSFKPPAPVLGPTSDNVRPISQIMPLEHIEASSNTSEKLELEGSKNHVSSEQLREDFLKVFFPTSNNYQNPNEINKKLKQVRKTAENNRNHVRTPGNNITYIYIYVYYYY